MFAPDEQQGTIQEDAQLTSQGQLSVTDTDQNEVLTVGQAGTRGVYGEFGIDTAGRWRYASDTAVVRHIEADATRVLPNNLSPLQREVTYWCVSSDANYDPLKAWKAEHGADVVEGWLASEQITTSSAASGMRVISRVSRCTVSNSAPHAKRSNSSVATASLLPFVGVKLAGNPFADYCLSIQYPERRSIPCPFRAPSLVSVTVVPVVLSSIRRSRLLGLSRWAAMDVLGNEQDSFEQQQSLFRPTELMYCRNLVDLLTEELDQVRQCLGQAQRANRILVAERDV